jgi:hypothetical protein
VENPLNDATASWALPGLIGKMLSNQVSVGRRDKGKDSADVRVRPSGTIMAVAS